MAGIRATKPIAELKTEMPELYEEFAGHRDKLEQHYREMQDMEFTIERGKLWLLQTRDGKRTAQAAVRIAVDLADEGLITKREALMRVTPDQVDFFLHPQFDGEQEGSDGCGPEAGHRPQRLTGAAVGMAAFDADLAERVGDAKART